jgi:hypothetical protein
MPRLVPAWTATRAARSLAAGAALWTVLWVAACAGDAVDVRPRLSLTELPQTFALETVDGRALPVSYAGAWDTLEVLAVTLTLHADSTYTSRHIERWSGRGAARIDTLALAGRFTRTAQVIRLRDDRTGDSAEFELAEGGDLLRGTGVPNGRPSIGILRIHVFRRVAAPRG